MKTTRRWFSRLVILALAAPLLFSAAFAQNPTYGGTLIFAREADATSLDAGDASDSESQPVAEQVFESLFRFVPGTAEVEPQLAESYSVSEDGTVWLFKLRQGVLFHDGTELDADAVVFSFERMLDKDHPYHGYGAWNITLNMLPPGMKVRAVSKYEVELTLAEPYAPIMTILATVNTGIVSPTAVKNDPEGFKHHPVGTGPFEFVSWTTDEEIRLRRFEQYWGQKAYLDELVFRVIPEGSARFLALQQGSVQGMKGVPPEAIAIAEASPALKVEAKAGTAIAYLAANHDHEPFGDVRVRQALEYAINREAIVAAFWGVGAEVSTSILPEGLLGYDPDLPVREYDPAKARALLAEAGLAGGFDTELWTWNTPRSYLPSPVAVAEAIQADLAAVGIRVKIVTQEAATFLDKLKQSEHPMVLTGGAYRLPDPISFVYQQLDSDMTELGAISNFALYRNPALHELNMQALREVDPEARAALYREALRIVYEDAPRVELSHPPFVYAFTTSVHGFVSYPFYHMSFDSVWIGN